MVYRLILVTIVYLMSGCTSLTLEGGSVSIVDSVATTCKRMKRVSTKKVNLSTEEKIRNYAGDLGATDVILGADQETVSIYKCPTPRDMKKSCDAANVAQACHDYAQYLEREKIERYQAYLYWKKGCDLRNKTSCDEAARVHPLVEKFERFDAMKGKCREGGDGRSCLEVMAEQYQNKELDEAIVYAQLACIKGEEKSCQYWRFSRYLEVSRQGE